MSTTAKLNAFYEVKKHSGSNEQRILEMIRKLTTFGATKKELEAALGMKHQSVTSKLSSLQDQGKIYFNPNDKPKDGCTTWYATPITEIEGKAKEHHAIKFERWVKVGRKNFNVPSHIIQLAIEEFKSRRNIVTIRPNVEEKRYFSPCSDGTTYLQMYFDNEMISKLRGCDELIVNETRFYIPEDVYSPMFTQGTHSISLKVIENE